MKKVVNIFLEKKPNKLVMNLAPQLRYQNKYNNRSTNLRAVVYFRASCKYCSGAVEVVFGSRNREKINIYSSPTTAMGTAAMPISKMFTLSTGCPALMSPLSSNATTNKFVLVPMMVHIPNQFPK